MTLKLHELVPSFTLYLKAENAQNPEKNILKRPKTAINNMKVIKSYNPFISPDQDHSHLGGKVYILSCKDTTKKTSFKAANWIDGFFPLCKWTLKMCNIYSEIIMTRAIWVQSPHTFCGQLCRSIAWLPYVTDDSNMEGEFTSSCNS